MKKVAMLALGLVIAPVAVHAQSASATVNATAQIQAFLNVQKEADVSFGAIAAGAAATLTPGSVPTTGTLGVLRITHNSEVSVSATAPTSLTRVSGTETLAVTFSCGFSASAAGALDGTAAACDGLPNRAGNGNGTNRTSYLQVGGSISSAATTDKVPGTYQGSLVFTVQSVF